MSSDLLLYGEDGVLSVLSRHCEGSYVDQDGKQAGNVQPESVLIDDIEREAKDVEHVSLSSYSSKGTHAPDQGMRRSTPSSSDARVGATFLLT